MANNLSDISRRVHNIATDRIIMSNHYVSGKIIDHFYNRDGLYCAYINNPSQPRFSVGNYVEFSNLNEL